MRGPTPTNDGRRRVLGPEPRSGGISLARGVSPGVPASKNFPAPACPGVVHRTKPEGAADMSTSPPNHPPRLVLPRARGRGSGRRRPRPGGPTQALLTGEIGDGPGHPQDAVIGPRRQPETAAGVVEQAPPIGIGLRPTADGIGPHLAVAFQLGAGETLDLKPADGGHPSRDVDRGLTAPVRRQIAPRHRRHRDLEIESVEERPRKPRPVALNRQRRTTCTRGEGHRENRIGRGWQRPQTGSWRGRSRSNAPWPRSRSRSSSGCRRPSSTSRRNSVSSSRKSTPLWASDTSPGWGLVPPPINAADEVVWCGALKGP